MELTKFIKLIKKHKWGLMTIPVLVMAITFFLVKSLPNSYFSSSRLSAGLTSGSQASLAQLVGGGDPTETKINQTFSNVTQTMQLKVVYDQVSYQLILHELTNEIPYRKRSKTLEEVMSNPSARKHAIEVYTRLYNTHRPLYTADPDQKGLEDLLKSMKYDYESLRDKIKVYRIENSDFIDVTYESENPLLSPVVVNTLCAEFITYYSTMSQQSKKDANDFLYVQMKAKKDSLDAKIEALKNFKIKNGVVNVTDEVKSLLAEINKFENMLSIAEKEVEAITGALAELNAKFNDEEKQYLQTHVNQEISNLRDQIGKLNDEYIKSNLDKTIKAQIDAQRNALNQRIQDLTDKNMLSTLYGKTALINQRLKLENDLALQRNSLASYRTIIANLNARYRAQAPNEAVTQQLESDITVTSKEYLELLARYNQGAITLSMASPIRQVEAAAPGIKQPSKKLVMVMLSGIVSLVVYLLILFVIFYLDDSIKGPHDLVDKTDTNVLGALPVIKSSIMDLQKIWTIDTSSLPVEGSTIDVTRLIGEAPTELVKRIPVKSAVSTSNTEFKKMIRATRFEINMAMMGGRNLVVTSLKGEEGKTLVSLSLVSSFQVMNKKVLLIDGNFINPGITTMTKPRFFIEDYLLGRLSLERIASEGSVTVLGNKGHDISLFEINSESVIEQKMLELKDVFDMVLIESSALSHMNQSKEWIVVADRVMCIYEANMSIKNGMKDNILYLKSMEGKFIGWILNKVTK